jgi:DHA1 family tetracycline resistance protein-like MFS transporter
VLSFVIAALCLSATAPAPQAAPATEQFGPATTEKPGRGNGVTVLLVVSGIIIFAYAAMTATVGVWSKTVLDWGPRELSLAFAVTGGMSVLAQILVASRLRPYVEDVTVVWIAGLAMGAGFIALAALPGQIGTVAIMAVIGFSTAIAFTCVQYLILSHAPVRQVGKIAGVGQSVVGIARIFGPATGGLCLTYLGVSSPFFLGALLAVTAAAALLRFRQSIRMRFSTS